MVASPRVQAVCDAGTSSGVSGGQLTRDTAGAAARKPVRLRLCPPSSLTANNDLFLQWNQRGATGGVQVNIVTRERCNGVTRDGAAPQFAVESPSAARAPSRGGPSCIVRQPRP